MRRGLAYLTIVAAAGSVLAIGQVAQAVTPPGTTVRASVNTTGGDPNGWSGVPGDSLSADGRWVAFTSGASNLVTGDGNGLMDIFVRDLNTNTTTRVSVDPNGGDANGSSGEVSINGDGTKVAFGSDASNLVSGDTNGLTDVFVRGLVSGTTTRISVAPGGTEANGASLEPSISQDGRWVAFASFASNLVPGDTNNDLDVFLADLTTGKITLVSHVSDQSANDRSSDPDISADGRYVAFESYASNLVPGDTNNAVDVFRWDRVLDQMALVSVAMGGFSGNGGSIGPSIDAVGDRVVFASNASDLVVGDGNNRDDVFMRDLTAGSTARASVDPAGNDLNGNSEVAAISGDGLAVAFESLATNILPGAPGNFQTFVRDVGAGSTQLVSVSTSGGFGNSASNILGPDALSGDGHQVAFGSNASDLVVGDGNGLLDVFVRGILPFVSVGDVLVPEPQSGKTTGAFTLTLSWPVSTNVTVGYATVDGTATAPSDYTAKSGTATIPVGKTSATVKITVKGDQIPEGDETFILGLSSPTSAVLGDAVGVGTIRDDYPVPTPWAAVGDTTVWEGDQGKTTAVFTITLSGPMSTDAAIGFATANGSAHAPKDYTAKSGTLIIKAGKTSATVAITIKGDSTIEPDESFTLSITSVPSGINVADGTGGGTIRNDD